MAHRPPPSRQFLDAATVDWIAAHRPVEAAPALVRPVRPEGTLPPPSWLMLPPESWFTVPDAADSIHGVRHCARVAALACVLAQHRNLHPIETAALCLAAAVHDCRRLDDRADPGHGGRAAMWLKEHQAVAGALAANVSGVKLPDEAVAAAVAAVHLHDVPYDAFTPAHYRLYRRAARLTDLLKAADCLDRYRLPSLRWWPDTSFLETQVPAGLHQVAFDLVVHSERARLDGATNFAALAHAINAVFGLRCKES